jgi:hypothetical protein
MLYGYSAQPCKLLQLTTNELRVNVPRTQCVNGNPEGGTFKGSNLRETDKVEVFRSSIEWFLSLFRARDGLFKLITDCPLMRRQRQAPRWRGWLFLLHGFGENE